LAEATPRTGVERARRSPRVFFGWWIVAAGAGLNMMQAMFLGQGYGAYVVLLRDEFGWSKTMLSAASSLREAESGILGPVQGWLLDRIGPRAVARIGVIVMGIGFMLFSQVSTPLTFYGAFLVMSIGGSMAGYMTVTFAAVHWFERRRATAISLTSTGFALGGMAVPITVLLLEWLGWRGTAFLSGVLIMAIGLPLTQILRHHPHDYGLRPDGDSEDPPAHPGNASPTVVARSTEDDFTLGEAVREPAFWWVSLGHASALFVVSAMGVHLISHLRESQGYSLGQASTIVFLMTLLFLTGTISGGFLGDRVNKRALLVTCMAMHSGGLLILSHAVNVWMVVAFTLIHGLAWGWRGPQMAASGRLLRRSAYREDLGVTNMIIIIGTIAARSSPVTLYNRTATTGRVRHLAGGSRGGSVFFILARACAPRGERQDVPV